MCIRYGYQDGDTGQEAAVPSSIQVGDGSDQRRQGWYTGIYAEIAYVKRGWTVEFEDVDTESVLWIKGPAKELRMVSFRNQDLAFIGTTKTAALYTTG